MRGPPFVSSHQGYLEKGGRKSLDFVGIFMARRPRSLARSGGGWWYCSNWVAPAPLPPSPNGAEEFSPIFLSLHFRSQEEEEVPGMPEGKRGGGGGKVRRRRVSLGGQMIGRDCRVGSRLGGDCKKRKGG